ncbi:hypothetical protein GGX14DRAFT_339834, partial [Mycena pura]
LGPLVRAGKFESHIGSFHRTGHSRRCQVRNLPKYVRGAGSEGYEQNEAFFSKSNALAGRTRYASVFHRQQAITTYLQHTDRATTYAALSQLLVTKYYRALETLATEPALKLAMRGLGVTDRSTFDSWLEAEREYLESLEKEPEEETLAMEYYQKLAASLRSETFAPTSYEPNLAEAEKATRKREAERRHAFELEAKSLEAVMYLESRLGVVNRWKPGEPEWLEAQALVGKRRYQRALDTLEGLIVGRLFELWRMNLSDTGYKLRKHIAKALQARSKAIRTALDAYNIAAAALDPPRPQLSWDVVVHYGFLAEFDLLRFSRRDVRAEPWAKGPGRAAMDQHFELLGAKDEIRKLDVEIQRFVTFMKDDEAILRYHEQRLRREGSVELAHQVWLYGRETTRFNAGHRRRLANLAKAP